MTGAPLAKPNISTLEAKGFQVQFLSHAKAILSVDFPDVLAELCSVLDEHSADNRPK